jgi:pyroglutamyl-peptidase
MAEIKSILLTGFEPYADFDINPSAEVAKLMDGTKIGGCFIRSVILPVSFKDSFKVLKEELTSRRPPCAVLSLGLNPHASAIRVERIAVNIMDYNGTPDNRGQKPVDKPIVPNGELAYLSTLPLREIMRRLNRAKVPVAISNSAGTHLCNCIMYSVLNFVVRKNWKTKTGFIHLPPLPQQVPKGRRRTANNCSMPLELSAKAVRIALRTVASSI